MVENGGGYAGRLTAMALVEHEESLGVISSDIWSSDTASAPSLKANKKCAWETYASQQPFINAPKTARWSVLCPILSTHDVNHQLISKDVGQTLAVTKAIVYFPLCFYRPLCVCVTYWWRRRGDGRRRRMIRRWIPLHFGQKLSLSKSKKMARSNDQLFFSSTVPADVCQNAEKKRKRESWDWLVATRTRQESKKNNEIFFSVARVLTAPPGGLKKESACRCHLAIDEKNKTNKEF